MKKQIDAAIATANKLAEQLSEIRTANAGTISTFAAKLEVQVKMQVVRALNELTKMRGYNSPEPLIIVTVTEPQAENEPVTEPQAEPVIEAKTKKRKGVDPYLA